MQIACISCKYHRRFIRFKFYCAHNPNQIIDDMFKERNCQYAERIDRGKQKVCPNCLGTGFSGGQPCPCSEKEN